MLTDPQNSADGRSAAAAQTLLKNWQETRTRIASAATRAGRPAGNVRLLAVSKGHPAAAIRILAEQGQRDFGENYLQQALLKLQALADLDLCWHYIGQLQANKTRVVAEHFHWVHTVDRERIAQRLNDQRPFHAPPLNVCIQVALADEPGKGGVDMAHLTELAQSVARLPRLKLRGLMCIPPPAPDYDTQLARFQQLAQCQHDLQSQGLDVDTLSMGMSGDLEAAVAAGATWVRIGTALFGERN